MNLKPVLLHGETSERIEEGKLPSGAIFAEFPTTVLSVSGSVGFISVPRHKTFVWFGTPQSDFD